MNGRAGWVGAAVVLLCGAGLPRAGADGLSPLMVVQGQVVVQSGFSQPGPVDKTVWAARQGTRWAAEDGVLRGRESPPDYQAKKSDHRGLEPRLSCPATPPEFAAAFSIRFSGGTPTAVVPFIEFGHHIVRAFCQAGGLVLVVDYETLKVASAPGFTWEDGRWYRCLAELKGDEFVLQIEDGPTLYARHPCLAQPAPSGGNGLGVAGPKGGLAELDDVTIWSAAGERPEWSQTRAAFPAYPPVQVKTKRVKP